MQVLGIGTDIIETLRIARMIERHDELFLRRVYTQREIEFCSSRRAATQHYAAHWAGKEAILRALGTSWSRGIQWIDLELTHDGNGRTKVGLGGVVNDLAERIGADELQVSLSHCRTHATAYAIAISHSLPDEED